MKSLREIDNLFPHTFGRREEWEYVERTKCADRVWLTHLASSFDRPITPPRYSSSRIRFTSLRAHNHMTTHNYYTSGEYHSFSSEYRHNYDPNDRIHQSISPCGSILTSCGQTLYVRLILCGDELSREQEVVKGTRTHDLIQDIAHPTCRHSVPAIDGVTE